jgi:hypothetical protein
MATPPTAMEEYSVSLVRDDVAYRLQRRLGLIPADGLGVGRRAAFWSLFAWLPIAISALIAGRALPPLANEPLLAHFGIHVRFLVAVPLFILAEGLAHGLTTRLLPYFVHSGVVPERELPRFRKVIADIAHLRDAVMPWIAILAIVIAIATISGVLQDSHEVAWAVEGQGVGRHLGFGAWWFLCVGRPIFLALLLGWLWRALLLAMLFRRIAGLDLALVPTHPDGAGGIGFLERLPTAFAPVVLAISSVLAAGWAHGVLYHGVEARSLRLQMVASAVVVLLLFLSPLLVFADVLRRSKRQALLDYGALVGHHGRLVRERWIEKRPVTDDALLEAPELGPVADTISLFEAVKSMRTVPLGKASIAPLALAAVIPMIAVLAIEVPVTEILSTLVKALL